jgi:hypothetical protein
MMAVSYRGVATILGLLLDLTPHYKIQWCRGIRSEIGLKRVSRGGSLLFAASQNELERTIYSNWFMNIVSLTDAPEPP